MAANQAQQISQALPGGIQPNTPAAMWAGNIAQAFAGDPSSTAITEVNQAVDTSQGGVPAGPNPTWGAAYVPMMAAS